MVWLKRSVGPDEWIARVKERQERFALEMSMIEHGWRLWPANSTDEERDRALEAYLNGGAPQWYPPGYIAPPVITEGKLEVDACSGVSNEAPEGRGALVLMAWGVCLLVLLLVLMGVFMNTLCCGPR